MKAAAALDYLNIKHQKQFRPYRCSFIFDEFIPPNIVIELQGDYWHTRPHSAERDARKAAWAKQRGYQLVTIWEHEIESHAALALLEERVVPLLAAEAYASSPATGGVRADNGHGPSIGVQLRFKLEDRLWPMR